MKFDTLIHIFALKIYSPYTLYKRYRNLKARSNGDNKILCQLFLADEYGLTYGSYLESGESNLDEFIRLRLGERKYELALNWGIL